MLKTPLCDLLGIEKPVFQGGMAWIADASLASAVSEAGGLGIIAAMNADANWLRDQIHELRAKTDKPFGVNVMLMSPFADEVARVSMFLKHLNRYNGWVVGVPYETRLAHRFDEMASRIEGSDQGHHRYQADTLDRLIRDANALARREFWKAGNAKRSWNGYGDE